MQVYKIKSLLEKEHFRIIIRICTDIFRSHFNSAIRVRNIILIPSKYNEWRTYLSIYYEYVTQNLLKFH